MKARHISDEASILKAMASAPLADTRRPVPTRKAPAPKQVRK